MAEIRSGRRGRPLTIDPEKELNKFITKDLVKMQRRLENIREETRGERAEKFIGSPTSFPEWVQTTLDILQDMRENDVEISYDTAKQVKENLKAIERLASPQQRSYGKALDRLLTSDYFEQLDKLNKNGSKFLQESNKRLRKQMEQMTPQQRQKFYFSRQFQDIRTQTNQEYEHIIAWAEDKTGRELTIEEAWAVVREQRLADNLKLGSYLK